MTIECMFSCEKCGIEKQKFLIIPRKLGEDIIQFTNRVATAVRYLHDTMSPNCKIETIDKLYIPIHKDVIGGPNQSDLN